MNDFSPKPINYDSIVKLASSKIRTTFCPPCKYVHELIKSNKLHSVRVIGLMRTYWLSSCSLTSMISGCSQLQSLDIAHNIDVNKLVNCLVSCCPHLTLFSFTYLWNLVSNGKGISDLPVLSAATASSFVDKCSNMRVLRIRHCALDEQSMSELLGFRLIEEADLSDNENLHGFFLDALPESWTLLKSFALRDCTTLGEDCVNRFAVNLCLGGCPLLQYIDVSCQWSFFNDSLLNDLQKVDLQTSRPQLVWREDQCDLPGLFGVDPSLGVDSTSGEYNCDLHIESPSIEKEDRDSLLETSYPDTSSANSNINSAFGVLLERGLLTRPKRNSENEQTANIENHDISSSTPDSSNKKLIKKPKKNL